MQADLHHGDLHLRLPLITNEEMKEDDGLLLPGYTPTPNDDGVDDDGNVDPGAGIREGERRAYGWIDTSSIALGRRQGLLLLLAASHSTDKLI